MSSTNDLTQKLVASRQSCWRAWRVFQELRLALQKADECRLPPVARPKSFEAEGNALKQALTETILRLRRDIDELEKAIEGVRPYLNRSDADGGFPGALARLNRAVGKERHSYGQLCQRLKS